MQNNKQVQVYDPIVQITNDGYQMSCKHDTPKGWRGKSVIIDTSGVNQQLLSYPLVYTTKFVNGCCLLKVTVANNAGSIVFIKPDAGMIAAGATLEKNSPVMMTGPFAQDYMLKDMQQLCELRGKADTEIDSAYHIPRGIVVEKTLLPLFDKTSEHPDKPFFSFQIGYRLRDDLGIAELVIYDAGSVDRSVKDQNVFELCLERGDRFVRVGSGQLTEEGLFKYMTIAECIDIGVEHSHDGVEIDSTEDSDIRKILEIAFGKDIVDKALNLN